MGEVGTRFLKRADAVELSRRGAAQAAQLREDEPHAVAALPARFQLFQRCREYRPLCGYKPFQVEGISIGRFRSPREDAIRVTRRSGPSKLSQGEACPLTCLRG